MIEKNKCLIGRGAVSSENPAQYLTSRNEAHSDLCVQSMLGNDLIAYIDAYKSK